MEHDFISALLHLHYIQNTKGEQETFHNLKLEYFYWLWYD